MYHIFALLGLISCLSWTIWGQATVPFDPSPFDLLGTLDAMTLDTAGGPLAGGTITVDGVPIVVPKNLLATLPALSVAWAELFANGVPSLPGGISWEAHVIGNRVAGQNIAGLVYIAQKAAELLDGFITSIDPVSGHFFVGVGTGIECVINDPTGRYGPAYTANPLWAADPDNPSIHATSGFPVCIPRSASDPLCPAKNRPIDPVTGRPAQVINFKDPKTLAATDPDPRLMVPLAVGDYILFTGTRVGVGLMTINALNANLGLFTAPGTLPAYVSCDSVQYGIRTTQGGAVEETRADGWTSDPSTTVQWFAQDIDPCTGVVTERNLLLLQPQTVAPIGRLIYRLGNTDVSPATKNVGFRLSTGTMLTGNNITAGQFIQPIFNFKFPELITAGAPAIVNQFEVIPFLAKGTGPYTPGVFGFPPPATPIIVGQLSPWPGVAAPATTACLPPSTVIATTSSTAPAATSSPPSTKDIVSIISASKVQIRGTFTVTVVATTTSTSQTVKLFLSIAGVSPSGLTLMKNLGNGRWQLAVSMKGKPTSVTVTSTFGGSATSTV